MEKTNYDKLVPEQELLERFGIDQKQLGYLRYHENLPYFKISKTARIYYEDDIVSWLKERRKPETSESTK